MHGTWRTVPIQNQRLLSACLNDLRHEPMREVLVEQQRFSVPKEDSRVSGIPDLLEVQEQLRRSKTDEWTWTLAHEVEVVDACPLAAHMTRHNSCGLSWFSATIVLLIEEEDLVIASGPSTEHMSLDLLYFSGDTTMWDDRMARLAATS